MSTNTTMAFADRLQELIADSEKPIKDLAAEIGISSGALSKYQNDAAEAGIEALVKIAKYFNVSTEWLLGLSSFKAVDSRTISVESVGLSEGSVKFLKYMCKWKDLDLSAEFVPLRDLNAVYGAAFDEMLENNFQKYSEMFQLSDKVELQAALISQLGPELEKKFSAMTKFKCTLIMDFLNILIESECQTDILANLSTFVFTKVDSTQSIAFKLLQNGSSDSDADSLIRTSSEKLDNVFLAAADTEFKKLKDKHSKYTAVPSPSSVSVTFNVDRDIQRKDKG